MFPLFIHPDGGDTKTAGVPGCVQEQPGDGGRADLRLRESAGPAALQQRAHTAAGLHR